MNFFGLPFRVVAPAFDEKEVPFLGVPQSYVNTLAVEKAHSILKNNPKSIVICADTVVYINGKILGKPAHKKETSSMLEMLSGNWHSVFTGVCVATSEKIATHVEETRVLCNKLSKSEIEKYIKGHLCHDKAGGYAIQESGYLLIQKIDGCFYNVMGFPINAVRKLLLSMGVDLFDYLK